MMKTLLGVFLGLSYFLPSQGQIVVSALNTAFTQNFDGIGNSVTATLPNGFVVSTGSNYFIGTNTTTQNGGTSGADALNGSSTGGTYNFANGVTASSTDRSLGFLSTGTFSSPQSIMLQIVNTTGAPLTSVNISFDYEKYRSGSREFDFTFFHGHDGVSWISDSQGNQTYSADANNTTVYNPPISTSKSFVITGLNIPAGTNYYFRWTYTGVGGSTNGQALGIDNFSVTAFSTPIPATVPGSFFRSKQSGDWGASASWQSSTDGLIWQDASLPPISDANIITIRNGHTINIVTNITADQLVIESGAILNHASNATFTLNDNIGDPYDMIVNGTYVTHGAIPAGAGTYVVENGGTIRVDENTGGNADDLAFSSNIRVLFRTGSVFQWNTNLTFETIGTSYFAIDPLETEKPIFRISANNLNVGSNSSTTINGLLDVTGSVLWANSGPKTFRDGITGTGNITQTSTGVFRITGLSAVIGVANPPSSIALSAGGGLEIVSGSQVELIANTKIDGAVFTNNGIFNCQNFIVSGSTSFVNASGATLGIGSADGITTGAAGNIQTTGGRAFNDTATYIYNGTTNQVTGNGLPDSVQVLSISSFGTIGNDTVTLTTNNTTVSRLNLNDGFFVAGISGNLNIADGGIITGGNGAQPNESKAGTITFLGAGKTEGIENNKPALYAVIIRGGVDFNGILGTGSAKILNRLQINIGGYVANDAPYYETGSTLIYNTGTVSGYGRGLEWGNTSGLQGYPHHVVVQNSIVDLFNSDFPADELEIGGNLIIGNANGVGRVYMNNGMDKPLSVKGNLVVGSNEAASAGSRLWLSEAPYGDLWLEGSFTRQANSFYDDNGRSLHLKGSTSASINTPGAVTPGVISQEFSQLRLEKAGLPAPVITLNCTVGINNEITFTGGVINTSNSNLLIVKDEAESYGGNTSSFVNGPLRKIGNNAFTFHVGKIVGSEYQYRKIGISAPVNDNDVFTAEFQRANARLLGEPVSPLQRVSQCEYWSLEHTNATTVSVTLSWTEQSPCNVAYVTDLPTLAVAKLNGSLWNSLGNAARTGTVNSGTITAATSTTVGSDFFTLASTDLSQNPLPFSLSSFAARTRKTDIAIDWMLTNNNDFDEFILERSKDGVRFETLKTVKAKVVLNTAAYAEEDRFPFTGWNYYRLRAINKIGKESVSQIVKVWFGREDVIRISPNPASEKILINFAEPGTISQIDLISTSGQVLQRIQTINFNTEIKIAHLHAGMYILRITGKNGTVTKSFIKQ